MAATTEPADTNTKQAMSESSGASRPAGIHWDSSGLRASSCNVATARNAPGGVALSFGASQPRAGGELGIELRHRVHLDLAAAQRLCELLTRLTAEYEARHRPPV